MKNPINKYRKYRLKIKVEVLTYYGNGKCACIECGESRLACLSIDHINGDGSKQRRKVGAAGGADFYSWLKKNGYPKEYQTLCMNCQWVKREENREFGD